MTGARILVVASTIVVVMCGAIVAFVSPWDAAAHAVIRWTARTSFVMFVLAYAARPLLQLRPSAFAKRLVRERKWIGLSFAASHAAHLAAIIWLASPDIGAFVRAQQPSTAVAAATFVLLFAMAITSIDAVKAKMSARAWKALHRTGMHFAWIAFATTYVGAIGASPLYAVPAALVVGAAALRVAAFVRARRRVAAKAHVAAV